MICHDGLLSKQQFQFNFCVSLKNRYLYTPVPKAAHTTMKLLLSQLEVAGLPIGIAELEVHKILMSPFVHMYQLPSDLQQNVFISEEVYRFSMVRDPFIRIVSCYLDKISRQSPERSIVAARLSKAPSETISFLEFLQYISSQQVSAMDMHWKPQTAILLWAQIRYDFIGRMETFSHDTDVIFRHITGKCTSEVVKIRTVQHHSTNASTIVDQYTEDAAVKALVHQIYESDFDAFAYDRR